MKKTGCDDCVYKENGICRVYGKTIEDSIEICKSDNNWEDNDS